ncbi:MAG: ribosome biogenesis GTPase Der [Alphaproteobacteria bacterium]
MAPAAAASAAQTPDDGAPEATVTVAILGRPNVGKSTLFNRLVGRRLALVHDRPGVTRDWREADASLADLRFRLIDTAGLDDAVDDSLAARMSARSIAAAELADVTLLVFDARVGVTPVDEAFARQLRRLGRPVILLANKCEGRVADDGLTEAYALGLGDPVAISAEHGDGMAGLHSALAPWLDALAAGEGAAGPDGPQDRAGSAGALPPDDAEAPPLRLAIIGRPNVGKSTLINRLVGEDRLMTGPEAGLTRESIPVQWRWRDRRVRLVDTAGMRRRSRVTERLERMSVGESERAMRLAEVVGLVIDATQPMEHQEMTLLGKVLDEGRAVVVAVNKWDQVPRDQRRATLDELALSLSEVISQTRGMPLVPVSALTGEAMDDLMPAVVEVHDAWNRRIGTGPLNRWLADAVQAHPPPRVSGGRAVRLRYITQAKARPPTFLVWSNRADSLQEGYMRYLVNGLREHFDLGGTPIRLLMRRGKNPFVDRAEG